MGTEKERFKDEFRQRVYKFALDIIRYVEQLPKEQTSRIISASCYGVQPALVPM